MWPLICAGLAFAALIGLFLFGGKKYKRLFSDVHLAAVARGIGVLKGAALARCSSANESNPISPDDPRLLQTRTGLNFLYTIIEIEPGVFVHRASVSSPGHPASAVGSMFLLLWAKVLGFEYGVLELSVSQASVRYAVVILRVEQQKLFIERAVPEITSEWLSSFRKEWISASRNLTWKPLGNGIRQTNFL